MKRLILVLSPLAVLAACGGYPEVVRRPPPDGGAGGEGGSEEVGGSGGEESAARPLRPSSELQGPSPEESETWECPPEWCE